MSGCVNSKSEENTTKVYDQNGIYFEYPGTWDLANSTANGSVVAVGDPKTITSNGSPTTFVLIQRPNSTLGSDLDTVYQRNYAAFFNNTGYQRISEGNITVNDIKAYENIYSENRSGVQKNYRAVWLEQNGEIFIILCSALASDFQQEQKNFDLIINTFRYTK